MSAAIKSNSKTLTFNKFYNEKKPFLSSKEIIFRSQGCARVSHLFPGSGFAFRPRFSAWPAGVFILITCITSLIDSFQNSELSKPEMPMSI